MSTVGERTSLKIFSLMQGVLEGDQFAAEQVDGYFRPRLEAFFGRNGLSDQGFADADDYAQETLITAFTKFEELDTKEKRDPDGSTIAWVFGIARMKTLGAWKKQTARGRYSSENPAEEERQLSSLPEETEESRLDELRGRFIEEMSLQLTSPQADVFKRRFAGDSISEVSNATGRSKKATEALIYRARKVMEDGFIIPAGFKRLSEWGDKSLCQAAFKGRLPAVKLLGENYSCDEWVGRYQQRGDRFGWRADKSGAEIS